MASPGDEDEHTFLGTIANLDDIVVGEADAAVGIGLSDARLVVGPVDVDESGKGVDVAALVDPGFLAVKDQYARQDQVLAGFVPRLPYFMGRTLGTEDLSPGGIFADSLYDGVPARRGLEAVHGRTDPVLRGGTGRGEHDLFPPNESQSLFCSGNP